jgi:arylsulfatase A-like enzyme
VTETFPLVDLAPTLLQLLGQPIPATFQGRPARVRDGALVIDDSQRPVYAETRRLANLRSVLAGRYKMIVDLEGGGRKLFDLENDADEQHNLRREQPELAARLAAQVEAHYAAGETQAERRELPPELVEKLKSLGYVH